MSRLLLTVLLGSASADVYMQYPPGGNNRLDEGGGNRNNNNRLFDSQNNAKGGYGYGGSAAQPAERIEYMVGSKLSVAWTAQHSCGTGNAECQLVIQYMCNDASATPAGLPYGQTGIGEGPLRDGIDNNTPDPNDPDITRGLHEPTSFYQDCDNRARNGGLYKADQNLGNNPDARRTRQNNNGARSGLECPEERDYWPYWHPTPWKDLAVMTNNLALCKWYQDNSQNVVGKHYCQIAINNDQRTPNTEGTCTAAGGTWTMQPAFKDLPGVEPGTIGPPECIASPVTRDNHLGNGPGGNEVMVNISIPTGAGDPLSDEPNAASNCVLRLRYNITTSDTRVCSIKSLTTKEACEAGGGIWSAFYLDSTYDNSDLNDVPPLPDQDPRVTMGGFLTQPQDTAQTWSPLELAVNTNQYGRTFQDRSHAFSIVDRPISIPANQNIYNLNVKGKRGNIVQTYPATEYDFHPQTLVVGSNDMVHIQWTGNDNTNNNGNNNGEGTNDEDRHNIVQIDDSGLDVPQAKSTGINQIGQGRRMSESGSGDATPGTGTGAAVGSGSMFDVQWEWNPDNNPTSPFSGPRDEAELTKQFALSKQTGCLAVGDINGDQQRQNCMKLNAAAPTVNLGLIKFKPGEYKYMSSRNNNFSNRAQKAQLNVVETPTITPQPPTLVTASAVKTDSGAAMMVQWQPAGDGAASLDTNGQPMWGYSQEAVLSEQQVVYTVEYSCNAVDWEPAGCPPTNARSCVVEGLPEGKACAFQVRAGDAGGWGTASAAAYALVGGEEGEDGGTDGWTVFAIVVGVLATVFVLGFIGFMAFFWHSRRQPPPPPPEYFKGAAPSSHDGPPPPPPPTN